MFGIILLRALCLVLLVAVVFLVRSHFRRNQVQKRVINQIKTENKIWNDILKQKDINKA